MRALVVDKGKVLGTISPNALVLDGMFFLVAEAGSKDSISDSN
jgi:hypothetical protein